MSSTTTGTTANFCDASSSVRVVLTTVTGRRVPIDMLADATLHECRCRAAEELQLDESTVVLTCRGTKVQAPGPTPMLDPAAFGPYMDTLDGTPIVAATVLGVKRRIRTQQQQQPKKPPAAAGQRSPQATSLGATSPEALRLARPLPPQHCPVGLSALARQLNDVPAHRRPSTFYDNETMRFVRATVSDAGDPEKMLRRVLEQVAREAPVFLEVVRRHPRDFLDAVNGVVGRIYLPLFGVGNDEDGALDVPSGRLGADVVTNLIAGTLLASAAGGGAAAFLDPTDPPSGTSMIMHDAEVGSGAAARNDDGTDDGLFSGGGIDGPHSSSDVVPSMARYELEEAAAYAQSQDYASAASRYYAAWCAVVLHHHPTIKRFARRNAPAARPVVAELQRIVLLGMEAAAMATRVSAAKLTLSHPPPRVANGNPQTAPSTSSAATVGTTPPRGTLDDLPPRLEEHERNNAMLAALDEAIMVEALATAAVWSHAGFFSEDDAGGKGGVTTTMTTTGGGSDVSDSAQSSSTVSGSMMANGSNGLESTSTPAATPVVAEGAEPSGDTSGRANVDRAAAVHLWAMDLRRCCDGIFATLDRDRPVPITSPATRPADLSPFGMNAPLPTEVFANAAQADLTDVPVSVDRYEAELAHMRRVCLEEDQATTSIVYSRPLTFLSEVRKGIAPSVLVSMQDFFTARRGTQSSSVSLAFVFPPPAGDCEHDGDTASVAVLRGVVKETAALLEKLHAAATPTPNGGGGDRISPTTQHSPAVDERHRRQADLGCENLLADLHRVLVAPIEALLPTCPSDPKKQRVEAKSAGVPSPPPPPPPPPTLAFIPLFSEDPLPFPALLSSRRSSVAAGVAVDGTTTSGAATTAPPLRPLIADYAVTQSPSVAAYGHAASRPSAPAVRSLVLGGASRMSRPPWLSTSAIRTMNVKSERDHYGGAGGSRTAGTPPPPAASSSPPGSTSVRRKAWTVLADTDAPTTLENGVECELFVGLRPGRLRARAAFHSRCVTSAVAYLFETESVHGGTAEDPLGASVTDTCGPGSQRTQFAEEESPEAFAVRVTLLRSLLDELASPTAPSVAVAFRNALNKARGEPSAPTGPFGPTEGSLAQQPSSGTPPPPPPIRAWSGFCLLHSPSALVALRLHAQALREASMQQATVTRSRLALRGPLSASDAANVRYVQRFDLPQLLDHMCRELLATRPSTEGEIYDSLIHALQEAHPLLPGPPSSSSLPPPTTTASTPARAQQQQQQQNDPARDNEQP